ncbi:MAG TPA: PLP-dependent aminotransferase family protein [Myxococcota bacterium]|nr:PLP-dependent aminotransferase family protein [Myxococcota bacterium]
MLLLALDGDGPLHRQLYRSLRDAVLGGRLEAGSRLPSTRQLAAELELSRNTVLAACEQLVSEGYAAPRARSGLFVADALPARSARPRSAALPLALSQTGQRMLAAVAPGRASWAPAHKPLPYDFLYGEPNYSHLPLETWARLLGRRARRLSARRLAYQAPGGAAELRESLAGYLARARGVVCAPEQIVIVHGSQQGLDLVTRLLVDPGARVVLEEPHYTGFSLCARAAGAELVHVPVDEHGLRTELLAEVPAAKLAFVTPSHQYPAGAVLSLPRRLALLAWAARAGAHVLEDDYDGEFRFDGKPLECLQALDRDGRVIYLGTASKLLFPALRIGWVVAPEPLAPVLRNAKALADTGTPSLEQLALADFIREGHLERHARRARAHTARLRAVLLESLDDELGERARVRGASAGLHVLLELPRLDARRSARLREECQRRGVGVYSAAPFYARPPARAELLLGYASLEPSRIREGVRRLRRALDAL